MSGVEEADVGAAASIGVAAYNAISRFSARHDRNHDAQSAETCRLIDNFNKLQKARDMDDEDYALYIEKKDLALQSNRAYQKSISEFKSTSALNLVGKAKKKEIVRMSKRQVREANKNLRESLYYEHLSSCSSDASSTTAKSGSPLESENIRDSVGINLNAETARDTVDSNKSEHHCDLKTTTCWIAAEHALLHARSKISSVNDIFHQSKIQESEYVVNAGFDESLIKSGVCYLEQIHVFVFTEVDATSPLLSKLGRIFSPFSSILFTESSSYYLPVFKDDGNIWDFDELIYFTAFKFTDGGSSAKMPLTVISLSETRYLADSPTDFSQGGSDGGEEKKKDKRRSEKSKERDRGDKDEADKGDKGDNDSNEDPEDPPGDESGAIAASSKISFEIVSEIYPTQDRLNAFQTLTMRGSLTIQTMPLVSQSPGQFSIRHVQFKKLKFGADQTTSKAYKQFHVRVIVDSQQKHADVMGIKPRRTPAFEREEKQSSSTKRGWTRGLMASLSVGPNPQGTVAGTSTWTNEEAAGSEKQRYTSRITQQDKYGVTWWGFNIDDPNEQGGGFDMPDDILPTVEFEFIGDSDIPAPPPEHMNIEIASYWSIIPASAPKSNWIRKFMNLSKPQASGNTRATSYSNLCEIVALETVPSALPEWSDYRTTMHVSPGVTDSDYTSYYTEVSRPTAASVDVTPGVIAGGSQELVTTLKLPTLTKLELSGNCRPTFQVLRSDSKSH